MAATEETRVANFDRCARELESNGYALLSLDTLFQYGDNESHLYAKSGTAPSVARAFEAARRALDVSSDDENAAPLIDPASDSGSWTGHHCAAVINGRYNQYREGFVFSNGETFDVMLNDEGGSCNFECEMNTLFSIMHDKVADGVLGAIERRLELPHLYFRREVGPTNNSSQWHVKRYVINLQRGDPPSSGSGCGMQMPTSQVEKIPMPINNSHEEKAEVLLPMHTDPSLISVVILDRPGKNVGGLGLEVFHPSKGRVDPEGGTISRCTSGFWKEIPFHGHDVAIIFVGSVLSYLTKRQSCSLFPAAKHRVVKWDASFHAGTSRMAATLFVRPDGNALMKTLPSPYLQGAGKELNQNPPTFQLWNARVAKNYMKKKEKKKRNKSKCIQ